MKKNFGIAALFTMVTTVIFGLIYPLVITGLAQALFPWRANGQLMQMNGKIIGSRIIGQEFDGAGYFHSRPSAAGTGYDATASGGSNLAPTNHLLIERVHDAVQQAKSGNPSSPVPVDLVTASGSGLDPDISPAAAEFQVARVARERGMSEAQILQIVQKNTKGRQFGVFGEPRVNVLELNLALDAVHPLRGTDSARERASLGGSNR